MSQNHHLVASSTAQLTVNSTTSFTVEPKLNGDWGGSIFEYQPANPFCIEFTHINQSAQIVLTIDDPNNEGWTFDGQSSIDYIPEHSEGCNSFTKSLIFSPDNKTMIVSFTVHHTYIPQGELSPCYAILSFELVAISPLGTARHSQDPSVGIGIGSQD